MPNPRVRNAADSRQVRRAARRDHEYDARYVEALRQCMAFEPARRAFYEVIRRAGVFHSVFNSDPLQMAYKAGQQDDGHRLQADIIAADENGYLLMMQEARLWERREDFKDARQAEADPIDPTTTDNPTATDEENEA